MSAMRTKLPAHGSAPLLLLALILGSVPGLSCEEKIGDSCDFNVDCSPKGDRLCDLSSPGGYCTIENCNADSCPKESVCIAFYPVAFLNRVCEPSLEDSPGCEPPADEDEPNWCDQCAPDERCIQSGYCASKASARRWCMKTCDKRSDCRDSYECRTTGVEGAEKVLHPEETDADQTAKFCAPKR